MSIKTTTELNILRDLAATADRNYSGHPTDGLKEAIAAAHDALQIVNTLVLIGQKEWEVTAATTASEVAQAQVAEMRRLLEEQAP